MTADKQIRLYKKWKIWKTECARVLYGNLPDREVQVQLQYRYTCPAKEKGKYLPQWLWDSCFHAISYRWFDLDMAWEEIKALFTYQIKEGIDKGMVPHMQHFAANADKKNQNLFCHENRSIITQPPLIATAAMRVYENVKSELDKRRSKEDFKQELGYVYKRIVDYHDWFDRRRADSDGLVAIIHPWEMGWDASQRWDDLMNIRKGTTDELRTLAHKREAMIGQIIKCHSNLNELLGEKPRAFCVKPVDFNAIRAADLLSLAEMAKELGKKEQHQKWRNKAEKISEAIHKKMIRKNHKGIQICDLRIDDGVEERLTTDSAAKFILLFGECLKPPWHEEILKILEDEIVGHTGHFNTKYRVPSVPTDNPTFDGDEYWRGNVWLPLNWLIYTGLRKYGRKEAATGLARSSLNLVWQNGFREFFNPNDGRGGKRLGEDCPQNQSWSAIVLDMLAEEMIQSNIHPDSVSGFPRN